MNQNLISAVFDSRSQAEAAVTALRSEGIDTAKLSLIGRDEDGASVTDGAGESSEGMGDTVKGALGGGVRFSLRTTHHQETHNPAPSSRPGTMPARKSLVIETPAATPKMTKPMLGGITGAIMPPAATRPAA